MGWKVSSPCFYCCVLARPVLYGSIVVSDIITRYFRLINEQLSQRTNDVHKDESNLVLLQKNNDSHGRIN